MDSFKIGDTLYVRSSRLHRQLRLMSAVRGWYRAGWVWMAAPSLVALVLLSVLVTG